MEFVGDDHRIRWIGNHALHLVPRRARRGDVAAAVLRVPGKAFAHRLEFDQLGKAVERRFLARRHRGLTNCTTPTFLPCPIARTAMPSAADVLPLPGPVWTMTSPFSTVFAATFRSGERRFGKGCVGTCRSRRSPDL